MSKGQNVEGFKVGIAGLEDEPKGLAWLAMLGKHVRLG